MKRIIIGLFSIIVLFAGSTFAETSAVRIGVFTRDIDWAPYIVAQSNGWWDTVAKKYGKTAEYSEFESLPTINEAFASNRLDIVFEAEAPAIIGKASGLDIKIKGINNSLIQQIIVQKSSNIQTVKDLKGKKIAVLAGSSAHQGLLQLLKNADLSPRDVEILDMSPTDAKVAFESKQVDAWAVWPVFPQQELLAGEARKLKGATYFNQTFMVMRHAFELENPGLAKDLVSVLRKAQKWIAANPKQAQMIIAKNLQLPLMIVEMSWHMINFSPKFGPLQIQDIQGKADFLYDNQFVKHPINVSQELVEP